MQPTPRIWRRSPRAASTVTFPDLPEAVTHGRDREEALQEAAAALASALSFYAHENQPLPAPGPAGRPLVQVSLLAAAKLALRAALAQSGMSQGELARRLGWVTQGGAAAGRPRLSQPRRRGRAGLAGTEASGPDRRLVRRRVRRNSRFLAPLRPRGYVYPLYLPRLPVTRSTVFTTNRSQAVRLPKPVALPERVRQVEIVKVGRSRLISPAGHSWDECPSTARPASDDFMRERVQPKVEEREAL